MNITHFSNLLLKIQKCANNVYNEFGSNKLIFDDNLENDNLLNIYKSAFEIEMINLNISFIKNYNMTIYFQEQIISQKQIDFYVDNFLSIDITLIPRFYNMYLKTAMNDIESYNIALGVFINFTEDSFQYELLVNTKM